MRSTFDVDSTGIIRIMNPDAPNSQHDALVEDRLGEFFDAVKQTNARWFMTRTMFRIAVSRSSAEI